MKHRILVVYYSFSGTTRNLAETIALTTNADICELVPEIPYSFTENGATKKVRNEIERGYCPKLSSGNEPIDDYDRIFIGTPNWFKSFAPPVLSFLRNADLNLKGKTLIPFCTHGGGGIGQIEINIKKECPRSVLLPGFAAANDDNDDDEKDIMNWLDDMGFI